MVEGERVTGPNLDYSLGDESRNSTVIQPDIGDHHIALRFSSQVKNPMQGFAFGRSPSCCDIYLQDDPRRRLSKVHFRIYLNESGVLMLEDMSTNGTIVDRVLLKMKDSSTKMKRTLSSGSKIEILMDEPSRDIMFLVRIPIRDGPCEEAYQRKLETYLAARALDAVNADETTLARLRRQVGDFAFPSSHKPCRIVLTLSGSSRWTSSGLPPLPGRGMVRTSTILFVRLARVLSPRYIK